MRKKRERLRKEGKDWESNINNEKEERKIDKGR